jgi:hypothetical protein
MRGGAMSLQCVDQGPHYGMGFGGVWAGGFGCETPRFEGLSRTQPCYQYTLWFTGIPTGQDFCSLVLAYHF